MWFGELPDDEVTLDTNDNLQIVVGHFDVPALILDRPHESEAGQTLDRWI